jgi:hypothetical protein
MFETTVRDRIFKTVILTFLGVSIVIQLLVSAWFYDKLKMLENRLSLYPVNKPVEVDLRVTVPELVEIDRKIDGLTQRLGQDLKAQEAVSAPKQSTDAAVASKPAKKTAKPRKANRVDVVEKVAN